MRDAFWVPGHPWGPIILEITYEIDRQRLPGPQYAVLSPGRNPVAIHEFGLKCFHLS